MQCLQLPSHAWNFTEEIKCFCDGHFEHIRDGIPVKAHFQGFAVVALPLADLALHIDIGKEVHLYLAYPVTFAGIAATTFNIKAEAPCVVATDFCLGETGKQIAYKGEKSRVGRGIRAGCSADRRLIYIDHLVDVFKSFDTRVWKCCDC